MPAPALIQTLTVLLTVLAIVPSRSSFVSSGHLDDSWMMVLHAAFLNGWHSGTQIVFTYGPWGLLYGGYHPDTSHVVTFAWVFLAVTFALVARSIGRQAFRKEFTVSIWVLILAAVIGLAPSDTLPPALAMMASLYLLYGDGRPVALPLVLLTAALALLSLVKFTALIAAVGVFAFAAVDVGLSRKKIPWFWGLYIAFTAIFWIAGKQPVSSFASFLLNSGEMASLYADAMAIEEFPGAPEFIIVAAAFLGICVYVRRPFNLRDTLFIGSVCFLLFLTFKSGFVRQDSVHVTPANLSLLAIAIVTIPILWPAIAHRRAALGFCGVLAMALALVVFRSEPTLAERLSAYVTFVARPEGANDRQPTIGGNVWIRYDEYMDLVRRSVPMPGISGPVDIYPWSQNVILAHGLNFAPRPVFQSYAAYSPRLLAMNAQHLRDDERAPEHILFDIETIDSRYPSFDDGLSWPEILTRYDLVDETQPLLVFKRRERPGTYSFEPLQIVRGRFGEAVDLPTLGDAGGPIWAVIDVSATAAGRLASALYKRRQVFFDVTTQGGATHRFRLVPEVARTGFLLSPLIEDRHDFAALARGQSLDGAAVRRFELRKSRSSDLFYDSDFSIRLFRLRIVR